MIEEITSPPFLDDTAQEMVTKLQAIANNINNNAGQVSYSNTTSQLQAETVQTAIDEVKGITDNINASLTNKTTSVTINTGCVLYLVRSGNVVTASVYSGSLSSSYTTGNTLCTLPSGYRPSLTTNVVITNLTSVRLTFNTDGTLVTNNAISSGASPRFAVTYVTSDNQPT